MKVIFEKNPSGCLLAYIHCETAAQQYKLDEKLFRHSEYNSKWDQICDEWIEKKYFQFVNKEQLIGMNSIITVLKFVDGRDDDFIKELSLYLEDEYTPSGYYLVKYEQFKSESSN